jgi:general secretion pathway protein I
VSSTRAAEQGFTLIEALVAFAGLAFTLAVALPLLAGGLRGVETADRRQLALALAESRLADATGDAVAVFGTSEGSDALGQRWRLTVEPYGDSAATAPRLARYEVVVAPAGGRFEDGVRLVTLRLIGKAPP